MSGLFISFEGPEGAGKSTQLARLAARLEALGWAVTVTREPGGTPLGTQVRGALLDPDLSISPLAEFLLYSASRAQLVRDVLTPALAAGHVVLCDRFFDSSLAYQGGGRGLDDAFLTRVTREVTGGLVPDLTLLLDLDPAAGLARAAGRGAPDRLERADLAFHQRVRARFLALAAAEPGRFAVLEAGATADAVEAQVWGLVEARLGGGGEGPRSGA